MLAVGLVLIAVSLFVDNMILSGCLGLFAATFLWGIHELIKQKKRVENGLSPKKKQSVK
jgi:hypothetical protein